MKKDYTLKPKSNTPRLTEDAVRGLADDSSFERGMEYYLNGAIHGPVRQGTELRGYCEGSQSKPYQVRVSLGIGGTTASYCTCPRGGFCKHIVALLLKYVHDPDSFREIPPLATMLASLSRDDLAGLVEVMVEREPSLMEMVEAVTDPSVSSVDVEELRGKISAAVNRRNMTDAIEDLGELWTIADDRSKNGRWLDAGTIYQELLSVVAGSYDDMSLRGDSDEQDDLSSLATDCVNGLRDCFDNVNWDLAARQFWLSAVLDALLTDVSQGGICFAEGAAQILTDYPTEKEWPLLERRLIEALSRCRPDWEGARTMVVEVLSGWNDRHGRGNEARVVIHSYGTPEQRVFLLINEGKLDEAVALATERLMDDAGVVLRMGDALIEAGAKRAAISFVNNVANAGHAHPCCFEWLASHCLEDGDLQAALAWQQAYFMAVPQVKSFTMLGKIAREVGNWDETRSAALTELERKGNTASLIDIALHERNVDRALQLLPMHHKGWSDYRERVARAAEKKRPREAIALYESLVRDSVDRRDRKGYAQAAHLLQKMRVVFELAGRKEDWPGYLAAFSADHGRLRALQEELKRAGLLP